MPIAIHTVLQLGMLYGIAALSAVVSFRFLRFPDLTVDGSFVLGAVLSAVSLHNGMGPVAAILSGAVGGVCAGICTAAWHRLLGVNRFFAGILTMMMLYSVNLRILGGANISLLDVPTLFGALTEAAKSVVCTICFLVCSFLVLLIFWSRLGLQIRACGSNSSAQPLTETRVTALTLIGLGFANALAGGAGALVSQYQRFADVGMGLGVTVNVFAALFLGEGLLIAIVGAATVFRAVAADPTKRRLAGGGVVLGEAASAAIGMIGFIGIVTATLYLGLRPSDTKLCGAILLLVGLVWRRGRKAAFLVSPGEFEK